VEAFLIEEAMDLPGQVLADLSESSAVASTGLVPFPIGRVRIVAIQLLEEIGREILHGEASDFFAFFLSVS